MNNLFCESDPTIHLLHNYCRLCADYQETYNLIEISEYTIVSELSTPTTIDIQNILENSFDIKLEGDCLLPSQICQKCLGNIINFVNFKAKCHESEILFSKLAKEKNLFSNEFLLEEVVIFDEIMCDESNSFEENSQEHIPMQKAVNNLVLEEFICEYCDTSFINKYQLKTHTKICVKNMYKDSKQEGPFVCNKCGKELSTLAGYGIHKKMHIRHENGIMLKKKCIPEPKNLKKLENKSEKTDMHVCYICGKTFKQGGALKLHIQFHTKTKPFECKVCGKTFYTKSNLKDHSNIHSNEKKFNCTSCDKTFYTYRQLQKHRIVHKKDARKLQCSMCTKKFIYPYEIQTHMMVHTGNKPYSCDKCDLKFRFSWDLKKHDEKKHSEFNEVNIENYLESNIKEISMDSEEKLIENWLR